MLGSRTIDRRTPAADLQHATPDPEDSTLELGGQTIDLRAPAADLQHSAPDLEDSTLMLGDQTMDQMTLTVIEPKQFGFLNLSA